MRENRIVLSASTAPLVNNPGLFLDMHPVDGIYEPLLGCIVLEQCQAGVDLLGLRLVHVKKTNLKGAKKDPVPASSPCLAGG